MIQRTLYIALGIVVLTIVVWLIWPVKKGSAPTLNTIVNTTNSAVANSNMSDARPAGHIVFSTADLPDRDPSFEFSTSIPNAWRAEYQPSTKAIVLYDPALPGSIDKQALVFIQTYTRGNFQEPSRRTTTMDTSTLIGNQPARQYSLTATTTATPTGYPTWWSNAHAVAEVQSGLTTPYTYTVFHFAPALSDSERGVFINAYQLTTSAQPI